MVVRSRIKKDISMTMKRTIIRVLFLVLYLGAALSNAHAFDFSSVCGSGQTLFYNILSDSTASVVYPNQLGTNYYAGYTSPSGSVQIPSAVTHGGHTYTVIALGNNAFTGCSGMTELLIPNTVTAMGSGVCSQCTGLLTVTIPNSVTTIGDNAFMGCNHLPTVTLPNAVTMIGVGTFQGCSSLASVSFGPSVTTIGNVAFEGCSSLTTLQIPDAVAMLGNWAFCNCTSLDSLYIGNSVSYILQNTFSGCNNVSYIHYNARNANCSYYSGGAFHSALPISALTQLVIGDNVQSVSQYAFADAVLLDSLYIGTSVSSIDANAFSGTSNVHYLHYNTGHFTDATFPSVAFVPFTALTQLIIGDSVQYIPSSAFANRTTLQQVSLPSSLVSIGDSAFYNCTALQGPMQFPATLTTIGSSAFQSCANINGTLQLSTALQTIGVAAFAGCVKIGGAMTIPGSVQLLGARAFSNCDSILSLTTNGPLAIPDGAFCGCDRLFQVSLASTTPTIGNSAFRDCPRLSDISIGNSLSSIGNSAFCGCVRLPNPTLPSSVVTIGDSAFYGCSLMGGNMTFPASVTNIGNYAFASILPITSIQMHSIIPPTINSQTFASASSSTPIYVPCGATLNYMVADHWEDFLNIVESAPFALTLSVNDTTMGSVWVSQQPTCSNYQAIIQAQAQTDYHFLHWSDGNTDNPRQLLLSSDTSFTAIFVSDNSYITVTCNNPAWGTVAGAGLYSYNDTAILTATPSADYHFQRWSDGNTQNPRTVIVTQDSLFVATFLSNTSTLSVLSGNTAMGSVSGAGTYSYQDLATITATPNYGYHFTMWNDGITANPRVVTISQDTSFTAHFAPNTYSVTLGTSTFGTTQGGGTYNYLDTATLTATANYGYRFVQWNDGNTDNPRVLIVTADTTLVPQFLPMSYVLTVVANDTSLGTTNGGGTYNYSTTATITASPATGCHFIQWNDGNTSNPRIVTVTGDATYTAQFAVNIYTIMVSSSNSAIGSVSGGGSYSHGSTVTLTATPVAGCHFVQWSDGNTDNPRTIIATENAFYIAQFAVNTYIVSVNSNNPALGTVSGTGSYTHNSPATLTATPNYGYHFVQWNDGNTANPRIVTVTQNITYTAQFDTNQYVVTALSSNISGGSVSGSGTYNYLAQALLTATPQPHYHFVQWSDSLTNNPRYLTVLCDTQLVADFQIDSHIVFVTSANPTMGHTSGGGTVAYGDIIYITATANYGYRFIGWSDGLMQNPRRVVVSSDTAFTAQFIANTYTAVITSNDTTLGVVSGGGTYNYLTPLTLVATPLGTSRFVSWSDGNTDNPRTLVLTGDTALQAQFVINTCHLDCQSSNPNMGMVSGSGTYNYAAQVPILATAFANHHFVQWNDGVTSNPRLVTLTSDTTLVAYFEQEPTYTITVATNDSQMGTVTGSGQYYYGEEAHLTATPREHCHFQHWSDGNTANPRIVHVIGNASYQAVFGPDMYTITLSANNSNQGAVYGGGEYAYGEEAILTAVPFPSAHFRAWSDGSIENPRTIVVTRNIVMQALFGSELGINDATVDETDFVVTIQGRTIHIIGASDKAVTVYDLYGRKVSSVLPAVGDRVVSVLSAGVYLVCPDGATAKKVVVL